MKIFKGNRRMMMGKKLFANLLFRESRKRACFLESRPECFLDYLIYSDHLARGDRYKLIYELLYELMQLQQENQNVMSFFVFVVFNLQETR